MGEVNWWGAEEVSRVIEACEAAANCARLTAYGVWVWFLSWWFTEMMGGRRWLSLDFWVGRGRV